MMNSENILKTVEQIAGDISPLSVLLILAITIVGAVVLIFLCNGGLKAMKKLFHSIFKKD